MTNNKGGIIIKLARINIINYTKILKNPIISIENIGEGNYKTIIKKAIKLDVKKFTLKEYDKKIVNFCNDLGIVVEDDYKYLPEFFEEKIKKQFNEKGPLNLGIIYENSDRKLVNKILKAIADYARFITISKCINSDEISKNIFNSNGIVINVEKDINKILKKCDIIIDVKKCELEEYK